MFWHYFLCTYFRGIHIWSAFWQWSKSTIILEISIGPEKDSLIYFYQSNLKQFFWSTALPVKSPHSINGLQCQYHDDVENCDVLPDVYGSLRSAALDWIGFCCNFNISVLYSKRGVGGSPSRSNVPAVAISYSKSR